MNHRQHQNRPLLGKYHALPMKSIFRTKSMKNKNFSRTKINLIRSIIQSKIFNIIGYCCLLLSLSCSFLSRSRNNSAFDSGSSSSDISEISERMRKTCGLRQNTLDCEMLPSGKRLAPISTEPRRASITIAPRFVCHATINSIADLNVHHKLIVTLNSIYLPFVFFVHSI